VISLTTGPLTTAAFGASIFATCFGASVPRSLRFWENAATTTINATIPPNTSAIFWVLIGNPPCLGMTDKAQLPSLLPWETALLLGPMIPGPFPKPGFRISWPPIIKSGGTDGQRQIRSVEDDHRYEQRRRRASRRAILRAKDVEIFAKPTPKTSAAEEKPYSPERIREF
jgi:hypothetical protein